MNKTHYLFIIRIHEKDKVHKEKKIGTENQAGRTYKLYKKSNCA